MAGNKPKRLYKSKGKIISGVCGGIADYLNVDPTVVRAVYALLTIFTGFVPFMVLYLVLLCLMPEHP